VFKKVEKKNIKLVSQMDYVGTRVYTGKISTGKHLCVLVVFGKDSKKYFKQD